MGSFTRIMFDQNLMAVANQYAHGLGCQSYPVLLKGRFFGHSNEQHTGFWLYIQSLFKGFITE
jgi:hypothetical protein